MQVLFYLIVHLLRAVKHIDHDPQSTSKILGSFCFTRTRRSCWCSTHDEVQRLCQCDVASVKRAILLQSVTTFDCDFNLIQIFS